MIEKKVVDRFAHQSGVRDQLVAEREVVLTYALHALREAKTLDLLAFKGGTCLRKIVFGSTGRFSEDLDFTLTGKDDQDALTALYEVFNREHHGVAFSLDDEWYETDDGFGIPVVHQADKHVGVEDDPVSGPRHAGSPQRRRRPNGRRR